MSTNTRLLSNWVIAIWGVIVGLLIAMLVVDFARSGSGEMGQVVLYGLSPLLAALVVVQSLFRVGRVDRSILWAEGQVYRYLGVGILALIFVYLWCEVIVPKERVGSFLRSSYLFVSNFFTALILEAGLLWLLLLFLRQFFQWWDDRKLKVD